MNTAWSKCQLLCTISALTKFTMSEEWVFISAIALWTHCSQDAKCCPWMWNARREICFRKRVFFRTLQLQCIVGAVHVSAQCSIPRIYKHQARSHIHLDSHIPAHTCSHQLTSAHHYSYLLTSRWSNANQHFLRSTQLCSSARSHIHLEF